MTMSDGQASTDDLLSHGRWISDLAHHLVRYDPDDAVQDVWIQAIRSAPDSTGSKRSWLGKVLLNTIRNRARTEQRRVRRESTWTLEQTHDARDPTPEEAAMLAEMYKRLAALVCELPDALRTVIHLRYVDGHEPAEIAKVLGIPAGTVRWRLKDALERLRCRLDAQENGGRSAWVGALTPVTASPGGATRQPNDRRAPSRSPLGVSFRLSARPALLSLIATGTIVLATALCLRAGNPQAGRVQAAQQSSIAGKDLNANAKLPIFTASAGDTDACPELQTMQRLLQDLKHELGPWRSPRDVYEESEANPTLERKVESLIVEAFQSAGPGCSRSISCRGQVCVVRFATPDQSDPGSCFPHVPPTFYDYLSSGFSNLVDSGTPEFDLLSQQGITVQHQYWRFEAADGTRVPVSSRTLPRGPANAFVAPLPDLPAGLVAGCSERWRALHDEYRNVLLSVARFDPAMAWQASSDNASLKMRVVAWASSVLQRPAGTLPFTVACRGSVCALTQTIDDDPLSIKWDCGPRDEHGKTACSPSRGKRSWFQSIEEADPTAAVLALPIQVHDASSKQLVYLIVGKEQPRFFASAQSALEFWDWFDWRLGLRICSAHDESTGQLRGALELVKSSADTNSEQHFTVHVGGNAAASKTGRCVSKLLENAALRHHVDKERPGLTFYFEIDLPLDFSKIETKIERVRKMVAEELASPTL